MTSISDRCKTAREKQHPDRTETPMTWIIRDPKMRSGRPTIRGTRVGVEIISRYLNDPDPDRLTDQEIHEEYPHVPLEAITWLRNHPEEWIHQ